MIMIVRVFLLGCLMCSTLMSIGQTKEQEIIKVIDNMFDGMYEGDSAKVRASFHPTCRMITTYYNVPDSTPNMHEGNLEKFIEVIGTPHEPAWKEVIHSYHIQVHDNLASVWTEYAFWRGDKRSHCGINAIQLIDTEGGWKIIHITDTRRMRACPHEMDPKREAAINNLMDNWHKAAAKANEDVFFGSMTDSAIYIGTDASERWVKPDFMEWSKAFFERKSAWKFKPSKREIYFSADGRTAWFEEQLDTWMGVCNGSGVLTHTETGWKIEHYHLSVTVPNDIIKDFIDLVKKAPK